MAYSESEIQEHRRQWVEALRSGKYEQDKGQMRSDDGYCCLGVACDISGLGEWSGDEGDPAYTYGTDEDQHDTALPEPVKDWLGVESEVVTLPEKIAFIDDRDGTGAFNTNALDSANDNGASFKQIADVIERMLVTRS